jgi:hypothetical protein
MIYYGLIYRDFFDIIHTKLVQSTKLHSDDFIVIENSFENLKKETERKIKNDIYKYPRRTVLLCDIFYVVEFKYKKVFGVFPTKEIEILEKTKYVSDVLEKYKVLL